MTQAAALDPFISARLERQAAALQAQYFADIPEDVPAHSCASTGKAEAPAGDPPGYPGLSSKPASPPAYDPPKGGAPYPLSESKAATRLWKQGLWKLAKAVGRCGRSYANLGDSAGHSFHRRLYCRWAGCDNCKLEDSEAEGRKVAKALEKFERAAGLWRIVCTLPQSIRDLIFRRGATAKEDFYDKKALNKLFALAGAFGREVFGTEGVEVALHPLGDSGGFNPHFEVLAPFWRGEWMDPAGCPVVRSWLLELPRRWADKLRAAFPAADAVPAQVQVNGKFADEPGRIVHRVRYAVDHHWARKPHYIKTKGFRFLAALRGVRLARGFGKLDDKRWKAWVESKPFAHEEMRKAGEKATEDKAAKITFADGCPICGRRLKFRAVLQQEEMSWGSLTEIQPGLFMDRARAWELRPVSDSG